MKNASDGNQKHKGEIKVKSRPIVPDGDFDGADDINHTYQPWMPNKRMLICLPMLLTMSVALRVALWQRILTG